MVLSRPGQRQGRVASLWRYPVKSLLGETLDEIFIDERGVHGDRLYSVRDLDGKLGSGKSSRRFRKMDGLLELAAHYDADVPVIDFPDGQRLRGDDPRIDEALSAHVGRPVTFAREEQVSHFDEGPLHLVTSSSVQSLERAHGHAVDQRRLRANLLLETSTGGGFVEDDWSGRRIRVGDRAILEIGYPMPRCVMLNLDQRDLPYDRELLGTLGRVNDAQIGVVADVLVPGEVAVGDAVLLLD